MSVRTVIEKANADGRAALIGYLPVGFPDNETSIAALTAMVDGGVDVVEIGLPYSDPLIDGPVIQRATEHALAGAIREGKRLGPGAVILVSLSGRGDKDVETASRYFGLLDGRDGGGDVTQGSGSR